MKRLFCGPVFAVLFTVGLGSMAFADTTSFLEVVSGSDIMYVGDNGSLLCSNNGGATYSASNCTAFGAAGDDNPLNGTITITATNFNGWQLTSTGGTNSSTCVGLSGPGCLNEENLNALATTGPSTLTAYYADSGFTPVGGLVTAFSSPIQTGASSTQTAYAYTGALGIPSANPTPSSGMIGSPLTVLAPGVAATQTSSGVGIAGPYNLMLITALTTTTPATGFNVSGNISAVPEPAAVVLLGTAFALCASGLRRRRKLS
jgi:hypothetical protein